MYHHKVLNLDLLSIRITTSLQPSDMFQSIDPFSYNMYCKGHQHVGDERQSKGLCKRNRFEYERLYIHVIALKLTRRVCASYTPLAADCTCLLHNASTRNLGQKVGMTTAPYSLIRVSVSSEWRWISFSCIDRVWICPHKEKTPYFLTAWS